jgi:hypothetical protein
MLQSVRQSIFELITNLSSDIQSLLRRMWNWMAASMVKSGENHDHCCS